MARAPEHLPIVREYFSVGQLSYSQARAICRVATAKTEAHLVELAQCSTAAQLENITRAYRRSRRQAAESERGQDASRHVRYHWDDEGNFVGEFSLPAERGKLVESAIAFMVDRAAVEDADRDGADDPVGAAEVDALLELIRLGYEAARAGQDQGDDREYLVTIIAEEGALTSDSDAENEDAEECHIEGGPGLATESVRRVACDASVVFVTETTEGEILDLGRRTRKPNRALRRALHLCDQGCRFPGCNRRRTQAHHVIHWTDGGPTKLDNLVSLCSRHHHRMHEGGYFIRVEEGGRLGFYHRAGYRIPDVPRTAVIPLRADGVGEDGVGQSVGPYRDGWDGTRVDLPLIVDGLLDDDGLLVPNDSEGSLAEEPEPPRSIWEQVNPFGAKSAGAA